MFLGIEVFRDKFGQFTKLLCFGIQSTAKRARLVFVIVSSIKDYRIWIGDYLVPPFGFYMGSNAKRDIDRQFKGNDLGLDLDIDLAKREARCYMTIYRSVWYRESSLPG